MSDREKIRLYDSLDECFQTYIGNNTLKDKIALHYTDGITKTITFQKFLNDIRKYNKCWGWCDNITKKIHIWFDKRCSILELISVLSHEMTHTTQSKFMPKKQKELDAGRVADITTDSVQIALGLMLYKTNRKITINQLIKKMNMRFI